MSRKFSNAGSMTLQLLLLVLLSVSPLALRNAMAQSVDTGAIGGTVTDINGALLPNTIITVTSIDTGAVRKVKSNSSGEYRVSDLLPGTYKAEFSADGFQTKVEVSIVVTVGDTAPVNPKLAVGSVSDKVEVTDETPQMNTQDAAISTTIDQNAIDNLPINGRRWSNFALLTPGVVSNSDGFGLLSFRGISVLLNNSTVDGADNNQAYFSEERGRTRASYSISQAAVQEFQVNLSNYSAEYGRAAGGVINTVTKSGGNQTHGELFFYDRDNDFGAENPYTTLTTQVGSTNTFLTYPYKPKDWRKQWGFGAGGPLLHDKLFWFYSYDQSQHNFPGTARASDPQLTFAAADATLPVGGSCATYTLANNPGDYQACAEAGALFGTGSANENANYQAGAAYYTQGLGIINSFLGAVPRHADQVLNFPKLDYQINDRNRLTLEYNRLRYSSPAGVETQASNFYGRASFGNDFIKEDFGILRLSTVLNNSMVNSLLFQYGRDFEYESSQTPTANEAPLDQTLATDPQAPPAPPTIQIGYEFDLNGFDIGRVYFLERRALPSERRLQGEDMVTWSHGNHTTKAGIEINRVFDFVDNLYEEGGSYSYDYSWDFIADYLHATTGLGGTGYQQQFYSFSQGFGNPRLELATTDYAGFINDDWRVTPRLTITAGVRYEYEYVPTNPLPNNGSPYNSAELAVPQTYNKPDDRNNIGPRVGFAYNVFGNNKTTVRAGYGIYYGRIVNSNIIQTYLLSGGVGSQIALSATGASTCAGLTFPHVYASPSAYTTACGGSYASTIAFLDKHLQNPEVHEADLSIAQDIGWNTVFSISYMGSFGRELAAAVDQNVAGTPGARSFVVSDPAAAPLTGYVVYPHGGKPAPLANGSVHTYKLYTSANAGPFTSYYHVLEFKSEVNSSYNALVFALNHRFAHNFSLLSNYTYANTMDGNPYLSTGYGSQSELLDPENPGGEYGRSSLHVRNRFVAAATYRTNFSGLSPWKREAFNGWGISTTYQTQGGLPYSPGTSQSASSSLFGGILGSGGTARVPDLGRNSFSMPKTATVDVRLSKSFYYNHGNQRYRFEILGEAFNALNHQNITSVQTNAYLLGTGGTTGNTLTFNPTFGTYLNSNSNTLLTPRQLQIAGRLYF